MKLLESLYFIILLKINDRKFEEMSLREVIEIVRRLNRLDFLVFKDDNFSFSYSIYFLSLLFR